MARRYRKAQEHKISLGTFHEVFPESQARRILDSVTPEQFRRMFAISLADCDYESVLWNSDRLTSFPPEAQILIGLFSAYFSWTTMTKPLFPMFRQLFNEPKLTYDQLYYSHAAEQVWAGSGRFLERMLRIAFTPMEKRGGLQEQLLRRSTMERERFEIAALVARLPDLSVLPTAEERVTRVIAMLTDSTIDSFFSHLSDSRHGGKESLFHGREQFGIMTDSGRCTGQGFVRHWLQGVGLALKPEVPRILEAAEAVQKR